MVDMELDDPEIGDPEMGDPEMGDVEMSDLEMVYPVIDPPVLDIGPVAMDIGPVAMDMHPVDEHYRQNMGVQDFGLLVSSGVSSSRFCSSKYMTPSGNQMPLSSCVSWTLSAALGALLGLTYDFIQNTLEFSTQEMVDCLPILSEGTSYEAGYEYVMKHGLHKKENYPYMYEYKLPCRCDELQGLPKGSFAGYRWFLPDDVKEALSKHPLTAGIYLYDSFVNYTTQYVSPDDLMGIYSPSEGEQPLKGDDGKVLEHAVLVIAYDDTKDEPFYIIKNWMGVEWGVNGYARVAARLLYYFAFPNAFIEIPSRQ